MDLPFPKTISEGEAAGATAESAAQYWEARANRYQEVHDGSPDGMMIFRAVRGEAGQVVDFEWLYCNASASQIVGRRSEDLLGRRLLVEMPGNKEAGLFDIYVRVVEAGEPHSHEFAYRHEGLDHWFRATVIKLGDGFYVAFSDLTVRKRAEEQAARLAAIVRSSEHAIYSTSGTGIVETWNRGAEKLYGYTSAEMVGQPILLTIPEPYRDEHEETLRRTLGRGGVDSSQTVRLTKAGILVPVSITVSPIHDPHGTTVGTAVIARDVSEQVKLQERLVFVDRMASVGTLAGGMAHEINNPLAYVSANLDAVIEEVQVIGGGSPSGRLKDLEGMAVEARGGVDRISKILRGLMTFSRADEVRCTVLHVTTVLDLSVNLAFNEIRHRARLVKDFGAVPLVFADEARLGQVFVNLLVNAAQAFGEDHAEANEIRIVTSTDIAGSAVVEVRDTGPGIEPTVIGRIFDPFFTTKPIGMGAGLGLSICRNIVTGMGGEISVSKNEGRGTTFRVSLPAAPSLTGTVAPLTTPAPLPAPRLDALLENAVSTSRIAILVVDDEVAVGAVLRRILRNHDVTVVTRAKDALAVLATGKRFDLILSDLMMPGMSGIDLYGELAREYPEAAKCVVFITGGAVTKGANEFLDRVANERMSKPFEAATVRQLVQRFVKQSA